MAILEQDITVRMSGQWFRNSDDPRSLWHIVFGYKARAWVGDDFVGAGMYVSTPCSDARNIRGGTIMAGKEAPDDGRGVCTKCLAWRERNRK